MGQPVNGHTLVCDGYRNGNEIHLNLGWGSASPWFNIDTVKAGGYTWTVHAATFGIVPRANNFIYVSYTYTAGDANGTPGKPYGTVTAGYLAAQKPATIRINSGHYPEALTISRPMRLESWDGRPVTIGR